MRWLLLLLAWAPLRPAWADEPRRLAVLPVLLGPKDTLSEAEVFAAVTDAARLRPVRVMTLDDYFFNDGQELADRALACGQDTRCIARQLTPFRSELGVVVIVNRELDPPLLGLILVDTAEGDAVGEQHQEVARPDLLMEALRTRFSALLDAAQMPRAGELFVKTEPPGAQIMVAGGIQPERGSPNLWTLPPGRYAVKAEATGYSSAGQEVLIQAGQRNTVELRLDPEKSILSSPWLWVGVGLVAAGAVAATAVAVGQKEPTCYCVVLPGENACNCP